MSSYRLRRNADDVSPTAHYRGVSMGLVALIAAVGCSPGPTRCLRFSDCDPGFTCAEGRCVVPPPASPASGEPGDADGLDSSEGEEASQSSDLDSGGADSTTGLPDGATNGLQDGATNAADTTVGAQDASQVHDAVDDAPDVSAD